MVTKAPALLDGENFACKAHISLRRSDGEEVESFPLRADDIVAGGVIEFQFPSVERPGGAYFLVFMPQCSDFFTAETRFEIQGSPMRRSISLDAKVTPEGLWTGDEAVFRILARHEDGSPAKDARVVAQAVIGDVEVWSGEETAGEEGEVEMKFRLPSPASWDSNARGVVTCVVESDGTRESISVPMVLAEVHPEVRVSVVGGEMLVGTPSRVAIEVATVAGLPMELSGEVCVVGSFECVTQVQTEHEGRGVSGAFEVQNQAYEFRVTKPERTARALSAIPLPTALASGASLLLKKRSVQSNESIEALVYCVGAVGIRVSLFNHGIEIWRSDELRCDVGKARPHPITIPPVSPIAHGILSVAVEDTESGHRLAEDLAYRHPPIASISLASPLPSNLRPGETSTLQFHVADPFHRPQTRAIVLARIVDDSLERAVPSVEYPARPIDQAILEPEVWPLAGAVDRMPLRDASSYLAKFHQHESITNSSSPSELDLLLMTQEWRKWNRFAMIGASIKQTTILTVPQFERNQLVALRAGFSSHLMRDDAAARVLRMAGRDLVLLTSSHKPKPFSVRTLMLCKVPKPNIGNQHLVTLRANYASYTNARSGPLSPFDTGVVIRAKKGMVLVRVGDVEEWYEENSLCLANVEWEDASIAGKRNELGESGGKSIATRSHSSSGSIQLASGVVSPQISAGVGGTTTTTGDTSGSVWVSTGDAAGAGASGSITMSSNSTGSVASGSVWVSSGDAGGVGTSGSITMSSGTTGSGASGSVWVSSGDADVSGDSGSLVMSSGTTRSGASGSLWLGSDDAGAKRRRGPIALHRVKTLNEGDEVVLMSGSGSSMDDQMRPGADIRRSSILDTGSEEGWRGTLERSVQETNSYIAWKVPSHKRSSPPPHPHPSASQPRPLQHPHRSLLWIAATVTDSMGDATFTVSIPESAPLASYRVEVDAILHPSISTPFVAKSHSFHPQFLYPTPPRNLSYASIGQFDSSLVVEPWVHIRANLPRVLVAGDEATFLTKAIPAAGASAKMNVSLGDSGLMQWVEDGKVVEVARDVKTESVVEVEMLAEATESTSGDSVANRSLVQDIHLLPGGFGFESSRTYSVPLDAELFGNVTFVTPRPPNDIINGTAQLSLSIRFDDGAMMHDVVHSLLQEPRGSFEQLSATMFPMVFALRNLRKMPPSDQVQQLQHRASAYLESGLQQLRQRIHTNGAFGFFRNPSIEMTALGVRLFATLRQVPMSSIKYLLSHLTPSLDLRRRAIAMHAIVMANHGSMIMDEQYSALAGAMRRSDPPKSAWNVLFGRSKKRGKENKDKDDAFVVALAARTLWRAGRHLDVAKELSKQLELWQDNDGIVRGPHHPQTLTRSGRRDAQTEVTALAALVWESLANSKANASVALHRAISALRAREERNGRFGSTQATTLALEAIDAFSDAQVSLQGVLLNVTVTHGGVGRWAVVDGGSLQSLQFSGLNLSKRDPSVHVGVSVYSYEWSAVKTLSHAARNRSISTTVTTTARTTSLPTSSRLSLTTSLVPSNLSVGQAVSISLSLSSTDSQDDGLFAIARVGIPAGLTLDDRRMRQEMLHCSNSLCPSRWETLNQGTEIVLYFEAFPAPASTTLSIPCRANIQGRFSSIPSAAYLHYDKQASLATARPLHVTITPPIKNPGEEETV